jgi:hypothetical protein
MRIMLAATVGAFALALSAGPSVADHDKGQGKGNAYGHDKNQGGAGWTPFGNAERVNLGKGNFALSLVSDLTSEDVNDWYGGVSYTPKQALTFADLSHLSADYNLVDGAGGGSPRFQVTVLNEDGEEKNIFIYLGTWPNFTDEPAGWESTGNLIGSEDLRFDTTQLGGPFYGDYEDALDAAGDLEVVAVSLVVDSGWVFESGVQTVLVDNVRVNNVTLTAKGNSKK